MEFAYLDESGDLGPKGSKCLVLTLFITKQKKELDKTLKWCKTRLGESNKSARWLSKHGGRIKFHSFPDKTLLRQLVTKICKVKGNVYCVCFDKSQQVVTQDDKCVIVGYLFGHIMEHGGIPPDTIIADNSYFNADSVNYFKLAKYSKEGEDSHIQLNQISQQEYADIPKEERKKCVKVQHKSSYTEPCLEAVDIISGSLYQSFENGVNDFKEIIEKSESIKLMCNKLSKG